MGNWSTPSSSSPEIASTPRQNLQTGVGAVRTVDEL